MQMEIERKFLLKETPEGFESARKYAIRQGYLVSTDFREIRVRMKGTDCFLTIKDGRGLERAETEISISQAQFDQLWPLTEGQRIQKTRYLLPWKELTIEVDVYDAPLAPLRVAEVEFESREACEKFVKPGFLGQEVTGQKEYSNVYLATAHQNRKETAD